MRIPLKRGFPCGSVGKESTCSVGDQGVIPRLEIPWRRERLPTPVFWPREFHRRYSPWASLVVPSVKHLPAMRRPGFDPWVGKILWRRKWQPTPVLLPGKPHGWRSMVGYSPWGRKESDMTERLHFTSLHLLREWKTLFIGRKHFSNYTFNRGLIWNI